MPLTKPTPPFAAAALLDLYDGHNSQETAIADANTKADNAVTTANSATTTANNASSQVAAKYEKPAGGIPEADLAAPVVAKFITAPGSPNNPITDYTAARPNLPVVWWNTYNTANPGNGRPVNVQPQDQIDARFLETVATPAQITGVTTSSVTSSSYTVSWTAEANSTSYRVEYRTQGTTTWTTATTTGTSTVISGRTASSTDEVRVSGVNSAGTAGPASAIVTVTLAAAAATTTLIAEGFETGQPWQANGATLSQSNARAAVGTYSLRVDSTSATPSAFSNTVSATGGATITMSARVSNASAANREFSLSVFEYDSANAFLGSVGSERMTLSPSSGFSTISAQRTLRAATAKIDVRVSITSTIAGAAGDIYYVDDVTVSG